MSVCKILRHYPNDNNWNVGDIVDITNPNILIQQGLVELYVEPKIEPVKEIIEEIKPKRGRKKKV